MENYTRAFRDCKSPLTPVSANVKENKFDFVDLTDEAPAPSRKRAALAPIDTNEMGPKMPKVQTAAKEQELTDCKLVVPPMVAIPKVLLNLPEAAPSGSVTVSKEKTPNNNNNNVVSEDDEDDEDEDIDEDENDTSFNFEEEVAREEEDEDEEEEENEEDNSSDIAEEIEERDFINDEEEETESESEDDTSDDQEEEQQEGEEKDTHKYETRYRGENSYYRLQRRNKALQNLARRRGCPIIANIFGTEQLRKYLEIFNREEIDIDVLRTMIDGDFQLVGLEAHDIELIREAVSKYFS